MSEENRKRPPRDGEGRPTIYNDELAKRICSLIASHSFGLKKLCKTYPDLPDPDTIRRWYRENEEFYACYIQAKRDQADLMAEEILDIADEGQNDWMETEEEKSHGWRINGEHIQRSRLRIDSRKWLAAKLSPKIYGVSIMESKEKQLSEIEKMLQNAE